MIQQTVNADRPAALIRVCLWPVSKSIPDDLRLSLYPRLPYRLILHIHDTVVGYNCLLTLVAFVHQYPSTHTLQLFQLGSTPTPHQL